MDTTHHKSPSVFAYLRDIIVFPVMVTVVIPYFLLYNKQQLFIPDNTIMKIIGGFFFVMGITLFMSTNYLFFTIAKGTLAPWSPKKNLVVMGPYRYCRNPMITGVLCVLLSEAFYFHSTNILLWACFFFLMNTVYFIAVEEPHLESIFGEQYIVYKKRVNRWLPKFTPYNTNE